ncbi:MAG TPA: HAMP domain-containing sensor histidine kinase [bacterium]|nr:HAMP domain-containing sensor histidine kinase [bacterium]
MRPRERLRRRAPLAGPTPLPPPPPGGPDSWNHDFWRHYAEKHRAHWRHRRPGFFMKVFMFFMVLCLALVISFCSSGGFTWKHLFHALGWIFLIQVLAFWGLRRMFGPMRYLMGGVRELAEGNLGFRFPPKGRGEFDFLAYNFNHMADRVQDMIRSKERLLLDVSHELRSPLTRLKVALEMTPPGPMRDSMARDIQEMETMLAEILETEQLKSDHGKLDLKPLDLSAVAKETAARYADRKPGVDLAPAPALWIRGDETRVRRVLQNVLENALKYSANQPQAARLTLSDSPEGAKVEVKDFGLGIPEADREKVFEPFYRVDPSRAKQTGGYGLGLSLCREIMKAHGGTISLASAPGQGTTVTLIFPR